MLDRLNRHDLSDEEWERLRVFLPADPPRGGRWSDHRMVINGIFFRARAGCGRSTVQRALDDAHAGKFKVLVVWALDRITREGAEGALRIIRQFRERGCTVVSIRESWLNGSAEVQDVLVAFAGWMARQESARRSERVRAGLARRRAEGKPVGRQPGSRDKKPRRRSGYVARWERERQAR